MFYGIRYNEHGQYYSKEELDDAKAIWDYIQLHKLNHPEILITDVWDCIVASTRNGWINYPTQWVLQEIQQVYILDASHFDPAAFSESMFRAGFNIRGAKPSTLYEAAELLKRIYSDLPQDIS
ncbi:hypothetical protein D1872_133620 [compost metagenome]